MTKAPRSALVGRKEKGGWGETDQVRLLKHFQTKYAPTAKTTARTTSKRVLRTMTQTVSAPSCRRPMTAARANRKYQNIGIPFM